MAQFKGTFQIFSGIKANAIDSRVRELVKYAFAHACITMMYEYALRVPVLSGMTRAAVVAAMNDAIQQFRAKGIDINVPGSVPMGVTEAKESTEHQPSPISSKAYKSPVLWVSPTDEEYILEGRYNTPNSWYEAVTKGEGQNAEDGVKYQNVEVFKFFGSPQRGAYSFFWAISVPHWNEYGWDLMEYALKYYEQDLAKLIPPIAKHLAVEISESLLSKVKTRGAKYGGARHLIAKRPTSFGTDIGLFGKPPEAFER